MTDSHHRFCFFSKLLNYFILNPGSLLSNKSQSYYFITNFTNFACSLQQGLQSLPKATLTLILVQLYNKLLLLITFINAYLPIQKRHFCLSLTTNNSIDNSVLGEPNKGSIKELPPFRTRNLILVSHLLRDMCI